jgi:hypothetical protein
MTRSPSLFSRALVAKSIGFVLGLFAFFLLPVFGESDLAFRFGVLFWLTTMGGVIALMGVMTEDPTFHIPLPWWVRGPMVGSFMVLILWLVAHERMDAITANIVGPSSFFASGAWAVVDGLFLGLIMGGLATWFGGEGKAIVGH